MKLLIVEPREVQIMFLVIEEGKTLRRGSADLVKDIEALVVSYGIPCDNILIINTEHQHTMSLALRAALGAKSVRISQSWSTGASFGYPSPDTYINSKGFDGGDLCSWVAREYQQWLSVDKRRQRTGL